jgi:hypothetical protein
MCCMLCMSNATPRLASDATLIRLDEIRSDTVRAFLLPRLMPTQSRWEEGGKKSF